MAKTVSYRAVPIERLTSALLAGLLAGAEKLVVAIDVAKTKMMAGFGRVTHQRHRDDLSARLPQPAELHGGGAWRSSGRSKMSATRGHALRPSARLVAMLAPGRERTASMGAPSTPGA